MDDCSLRYGWVTTYNDTVLIKRTGDYTFIVSPSIPRHQKSTTEKISVREALFFLALRQDFHYPSVGLAVVSFSVVWYSSIVDSLTHISTDGRILPGHLRKEIVKWLSGRATGVRDTCVD